jgi:hypothetical protein
MAAFFCFVAIVTPPYQKGAATVSSYDVEYAKGMKTLVDMCHDEEEIMMHQLVTEPDPAWVPAPTLEEAEFYAKIVCGVDKFYAFAYPDPARVEAEAWITQHRFDRFSAGDGAMAAERQMWAHELPELRLVLRSRWIHSLGAWGKEFNRTAVALARAAFYVTSKEADEIQSSCTFSSRYVTRYATAFHLPDEVPEQSLNLLLQLACRYVHVNPRMSPAALVCAVDNTYEDIYGTPCK